MQRVGPATAMPLLCIQLIYNQYLLPLFPEARYGIILHQSFWGKGFDDKMSFFGRQFGGVGLY